ncbi:MAG: serine hydrolase [Bacteroidales bacterium]|nr:serine hydrolase [Bacteroidales bacterium]
MKYHLIKSSIFVFLFTWVQISAISQQTSDYNSLKKYIQQGNDMFNIPGMAVGIIKDGEIVFSEGFGNRNTITGDKVTPETVFGIASCSKAFTVACIAILVKDGKLEWTDKVIDHYPEFKLFDPYITREMEVQDLLSHCSGFQTFDGDLLWYASNYTREEIMHRIQYRENPYSFRSRFGYQNVMFIAAGELIKKVSGLSWDAFLTEKILQPLSMESTSTSNIEFGDDMNIAHPHHNGQQMDFLNYDNSGPAASMNSSVTDLLKWVKLLLYHGAYEGNEIFSSNQYYKMTSMLTPLNADIGETIGGRHFFGYGLGWFLLDFKGRKIIQHGGGLPGFHSKVVLVPEENLGFVILTNQLSGLVEATYKKILDFYLVDDGKDWAQLYYDNEKKGESEKAEKQTERENSRVIGTKPSLSLEKYTGTYTDKMYGNASISHENGQLKIVLLPAKELFTATLEHWHYDTFKFQFNDPFLPEGYATFKIGKDGTPECFTIDLDNPDFHFYKLKFENISK